MKKLIVLCSAITVMVIVGYVSISNLMDNEIDLYKTVSSNKIKEKEENQEDFIAFFYQKNCSACKQVKPIINDYIDSTKKDVFAVDINADDNKNLLKQGFNIKGTPTVIFFDSGEEQDRFTTIFGKEEFNKKAALVYK